MAPSSIGPYWDVLDIQSPTNHTETIRVGVLSETFQIAARTGSAIAQYFFLVRGGMSQTLHIFRGVERRMKHEMDMNADEKILAYVWRPSFDVEWSGGRHSTAYPARLEAPDKAVFVALVRPYVARDAHGIDGALLKWNWVDADATLAPIDKDDRYREHLWSKSL